MKKSPQIFFFFINVITFSQYVLPLLHPQTTTTYSKTTVITTVINYVSSRLAHKEL